MKLFHLVSGVLLLAVHGSAVAEEIYVGDLIDRVISGEDFTGQELVLTGVALSETSRDEDRLLKLGTAESYQSGDNSDFVAVYDASESIEEALVLRVRVVIDTSTTDITDGDLTVVIEATFRECIPSCEPSSL